MNYLKTLFPILLCLSIIVFSAGCISPPSEDNAKTITIWAYDSAANVANEAVNLYQLEHPDCEYSFNVVTLGQDDLVEKIKVYLSTNSLEILPDIFYDEDYNFLEYLTYYSDSFVDLSNLLDINDFYEFKGINVIYNNKIYAIPYDCGTGVLFYRSDLIKKAGYSDDDMRNLTWEKYIEIGKNIKSIAEIDMLPIIPDGDMEGRLFYQSSGTWFFDENGVANIKGNSGFTNAFTAMKSAFDADIVYNAVSWDDMVSGIANEKFVSFIGGSWWAPIISSYNNQHGKWKVAEMPKINGGVSYSNLGGGNWFVLNKENATFSAQFAIEMFSKNQDIANIAANKYYLVPVSKSLASNVNSSDDPFFGNQNIVDFLIQTEPHIIPVKYGLHTYEITYVVGEYAGQYINGNLSLTEAINKMQSAAEKVVSSN